MTEKPVAIITGASRGIGKAIAKELAGLGYDLVINYFDFTCEGKPDDSVAKKAQSEIEDIGSACHILRSDVGCSEGRKKLIDLTEEKFGRCDMLINNAGHHNDGYDKCSQGQV